MDSICSMFNNAYLINQHYQTRDLMDRVDSKIQHNLKPIHAKNAFHDHEHDDIYTKIRSLEDKFIKISIKFELERTKLRRIIKKRSKQCNQLIADLESQFFNHINIDSDFIKSIQVTPVYDYSLIKARKQRLHNELKAMYKVFNRMIEVPLAVSIDQSISLK